MTADFLVSPLRTDLEIIPGPNEDDGSPTAIICDSFNMTFDRLGWRECEVVKRLMRPIYLSELSDRLRNETTAEIDAEELLHFLRALSLRGLLRSRLIRSPAELEAEEKRANTGVLTRFRRHYLFFRIPLLRPDRFLVRTLWLPAVLGSRAMCIVYCLAVIAALFVFIPRSGVFLDNVQGMLAWRGAFMLTVALAAIKSVHEFSHAYAARIRGVRVREMGIAFMLFAPIPYTDVTDSWRLPRRGRLGISAAGVAAELVVAAFALLGWSLFPPGGMRDVCLLLSTASVVSTLATNLNPGLRFDGYYLLSDLLGVDNLQLRAYALARRFFRLTFLGLPTPEVETAMPAWKRGAMTVYALYAWLYRLTVYFGIAYAIYLFFPKVVGVALFGAELATLVVRPIAREVVASARLLARQGRPRMRFWFFMLALALFLSWLAAPLPRRLRLHAVVTPSEQTWVYVPDSGLLTEYKLKRGDVVPAGTVLLAVENQDLTTALAEAALRNEEAGMMLEYVLAPGKGRSRLRDRIADSDRLASHMAGIGSGMIMNTWRADTDSLVLDADNQLRPGVFVAKRRLAARLVPVHARRRVAAYVPEDYAGDVHPGDVGRFVPACSPGAGRAVTVSAIRSDAATRIEEPELARPGGGGIDAIPMADGGMQPVGTMYKMEAGFDDVEPASFRFGQTGTLWLRTRPRSYLYEGAVWVYRVLLRESGF